MPPTGRAGRESSPLASLRSSDVGRMELARSAPISSARTSRAAALAVENAFGRRRGAGVRLVKPPSIAADAPPSVTPAIAVARAVAGAVAVAVRPIVAAVIAGAKRAKGEAADERAGNPTAAAPAAATPAAVAPLDLIRLAAGVGRRQRWGIEREGRSRLPRGGAKRGADQRGCGDRRQFTPGHNRSFQGFRPVCRFRPKLRAGRSCGYNVRARDRLRRTIRLARKLNEIIKL